MAKVELKGIGKVYDGSVRAVDNANIVVDDQEFVVFVGPSGCGKSTTLRMVAGLEEITEGDLFIDGERMNDVPPKDRNIAMVFQNYALYPHMTVYDNMAFGLKIRKVDKKEIERRVNEAAHILDIEKLLDRKPKALSGGQRQRVAVGRAIVRHLLRALRICQQVDQPGDAIDRVARFGAEHDPPGIKLKSHAGLRWWCRLGRQVRRTPGSSAAASSPCFRPC